MILRGFAQDVGNVQLACLALQREGPRLISWYHQCQRSALVLNVRERSPGVYLLETC